MLIKQLSSESFESVRILLISSNSEADLITIPLFFVATPVAALTGLISIAIDSLPPPPAANHHQFHDIINLKFNFSWLPIKER
jgi:hypothetical protein